MKKTMKKTTKTSTKVKKHTAKQLRMFEYNKVLKSLKGDLCNVMSRKEFVETFNIQSITHTGKYRNVHKSNLRLVQAQAEINDLLRESGMRIKSKDYYTKFYLMPLEETKNHILNRDISVERIEYLNDHLADKFVNAVNKKSFGKYRNVKQVDIKEISKTFRPSSFHYNLVSGLDYALA